MGVKVGGAKFSFRKNLSWTIAIILKKKSFKSVKPFSSYGFCHAPPPTKITNQTSQCHSPEYSEDSLKISSKSALPFLSPYVTYIHTSCFIYIDWVCIMLKIMHFPKSIFLLYLKKIQKCC